MAAAASIAAIIAQPKWPGQGALLQQELIKFISSDYNEATLESLIVELE
jgi:hypothetical protein